MIKLKITMNDIDKEKDLLEFVEKVFIKRNWDLFLSLVLEIDKDQLIELINKKIVDQISQKIKLYILAEKNTPEFKDLLNENRIESYDTSYNQKTVNFSDITNFDSIDDLLLNILDFNKQKGLIPTIVQDLDNNILMLA
ncbi:MAG: hypothetical protein P8Y23_17650 [Candidatus Lokiarchaeota archaeon]